MNQPNKHIQQKFYQVLKRKISVQDFEKWVYETKELETVLEEDLYTDLISLNYQSKFALNELEKLIGELVNYGQFELEQIKYCLESIIRRDKDCGTSIEMTYDLYCSGYKFLRRLGLIYGLSVSFPQAGDYKKPWNEISGEDQHDLLCSLYPPIITDAKNALNWIKNKRIIIRNSVNELGQFEYDDFRTASEIQEGRMDN